MLSFLHFRSLRNRSKLPVFCEARAKNVRYLTLYSLYCLLGTWFLWAAISFQSLAAFPPEADLDEVKEQLGRVPSDHPRLLVTKEKLASLQKEVAGHPWKRRVADHVVAEARRIFQAKPVERKLTGRRLLHKSRECLERVMLLCTAYHLTGETRYLRRCEEEMLAAARFEDWNPDHFLDVGEMTLALAIGYDWLFQELKPSSREVIRRAMIEKSLKLPFDTPHNGWVRSRNNWGQVCHGGLTAGALAILEDAPDLAARTIHNAIQNVPFSMEAYAPKGSYPEGPSYWAYGTTYNVILIDALIKALGTDFGLSEAPGFSQTGRYPALVTGPSGLTFNYSDGGSGRGPQPALFWFAQRLNRPDWLQGEWATLENKLSRAGRFLPLVLIWGEDLAKTEENRLPLHWESGGPVPITIHRSSWEIPKTVFVGFKGGSPSANHGQMDIGSFVLDAGGTRWASDLGAEGYHGIESRGMNLWDRSQDSDRWTIFRQMNLGHNTLVIDNHLQKASGHGTFVQFSDASRFPYSILDMSTIYEDQAGSVRRGIALTPSGCVRIQDELMGLRTGAKVRWGMITMASAGESGKDTIQLFEKGKNLRLTILSPANVVWQSRDITQPRNEWDSPNPGATLISFEPVATGEGNMTLTVLAQPGTVPEPERLAKTDIPLNQWQERFN